MKLLVVVVVPSDKNTKQGTPKWMRLFTSQQGTAHILWQNDGSGKPAVTGANLMANPQLLYEIY